MTKNAATLTTVLGAIPAESVGVTDAHQHVWIEPVLGVDPGAPQLEDLSIARAGLAAYKAAGGSAILDCQPDGCGRNAAVLAALSANSGVAIICCTGFHLRKYYPPDHWLWSASEAEAGDYFIRELQDGVSESPAGGAVRAGFIKVACSADLANTPMRLLAAAAEASRQTGAAVLTHTEQGASADQILRVMTDFGMSAGRLVLCHMDKRPDAGLHRALAQAGALLEYDTFFRPKYEPEKNVWPLVSHMLAEGFARSIAFGTDLAHPESWRNPGPAGLPAVLAPRLAQMGCASDAVAALTGQNIVARLAGRARLAGGSQTI
jgi:phosphotriesterase-related protein